MFGPLAAGLIVFVTAAITRQVTKHGWASLIDDDKVNPEQAPQPKHSRAFYDWKKDKGFKDPNERKNA